MAVTFFCILISTAVINVGILLSVLTGLILITKEKKYLEVFIKNKINLTILLLMLTFIFSYSYSIASFEEAIASLKKYIRLLFIPICYYILKIDWIRDKAINYFIAGCTIIMYLKYFHIIEPISFEKFANFLGLDYQYKLLSGVTITQHSIIHGLVLSFYFIITYLKANKTSSILYYLLSFLSFYNVLFMNLSRTSFIIISILIMLIIFSYCKNKNYKKTFIAFVILSLILIIGNKTIMYERYNNAINDLTSIKNNSYNTSLGLRYVYAENGIENIKLKPIFGHGIGSYKNTIKNYFSKNNLELEFCCLTQNPHNEFISISTQTGLFGLFIYLSFIFFLIKDLHSTQIGKSVIAIIIVSSFFNSIFYDNVICIFSVLMISLAMQKMPGFNIKQNKY